ncbi:hypothetical protein ACQEVC_45555 [Plantactinospora sp. CA-294935]|uniref:hypothetical protein n=1 Tax=Plantactinospora sp. CA-294935 TaxID=3240012 RepID=UPI003D926B50
MSTFVVPPLDEEPWPTLGPGVCDLIQDRAVFGPGSLKGQPAKLDDETRAIIYKAYEVYPRRHELAGRRRFRRVRISARKGTAKTEKLGWIAFAELHPEAEVRFDGWNAAGEPVGRPVRDPYIPLLAYTAEQVEELAYNVLYVVCTEGPDADLFDAGLERIIRLDERGRADGKAVPLAQSPNARDGARTTFQGYDETHRLDLPRHVAAYDTMEANLPKRPLDDPWSMGITTAGVPGGGSVAEQDKDEAEAIARGEIDEPELFYFHREAGPHHDLKTLTGRIEAIREASGPAAAWSDLRGIAKQWDRPKADKAYLERVWTNRWTQAEAQAFDAGRWIDLARLGRKIPRGASVTAGLDGARWRDTTALVVTEIETGFQHRFGLWIPEESPGGEIKVAEVDDAVAEMFERWRVLRFYGDPAAGWDDPLSRWSGTHGPKVVAFWYTDSRNLRKTAFMCRTYSAAIRAGEVTNDGDDAFTRHIGAAQKRFTNMVDDEGQRLWVMAKERHDSPKKIDCAMAGGLSWQARLDVLASGLWSPEPEDTRVIVFR